MSVKYKILFVVELMHDYYANKQSIDFEVIPSLGTVKVLQGQSMLYRVIGNKLIVLVKVNTLSPDENKPFISFAERGKLTFYLRVDNPQFFNITNINFQPSQAKRYYFSNVNENKEGTTLNLTSKIAEYDNTNAYNVGSVAATNTGEIFEAIKSSSNGNQHGLNDSLFWKSKGNVQYVTDEDLIQLSPSVYYFNTSPDTNFTIKIFGLNPLTGAYDVQVKETEEQTFTVSQTKVAIKLSDIPPGKYRIQVNAESEVVYVDSEALYRNVFGIVEIFNYLPPSNDFAVLDTNGISKENSYSIRFANRSVIWKYRAKTTDITAINDTLYTFTPIAPAQFISTEPIPLTEKPLNTLSIQSTIFGNITSVANPIRDRLQVIAKDGDTYYCAEKFLNY